VGQDGLDSSRHAGIVRPQPEIGQGAEPVQRVFGIIVPRERSTGPGDGFGDQCLYLGVGQHLGTRCRHLEGVRRPIEQVHQRAVAGPGFL